MARRAITGIALLAALAGTGLMITPAHAELCEISIEDNSCGGGDGGGSGGGTGPAYFLQGVIQNQGYETDPHTGGRRVDIRGYSRLADANNNRVDADYINVQCYAHDALGGWTTDYDEEYDGALVDVHFASNFVTGIGGYRTITVNCTHHATKYGVSYDTTSTTQINIPQ